jgi:IS30 family transposase
MSYEHINTEERSNIEILHQLGYSARKIAEILRRHHSSISRELKRNTSKTGYQKDLAQYKYQIRRRACKPKGKLTPEIANEIKVRMQCRWSPEAIVGRLFQGELSFKTIYRWLYQGLLPGVTKKDLRFKGKRRKSGDKRGHLHVGRAIHDRPKAVENREEFGHWEADTIVSGRGKSRTCLATFLERKSRMYLAIQIEDRTASSMQKAIHEVVYRYPEAFKTVTVDRGKEFACSQKIEEELELPMYFADPYSSWQRGANENSNGLLREFIPKSSDISKVSKQQLAVYLAYIVHRPRKCLGFKTAYEVFMEEWNSVCFTHHAS